MYLLSRADEQGSAKPPAPRHAQGHSSGPQLWKEALPFGLIFKSSSSSSPPSFLLHSASKGAVGARLLSHSLWLCQLRLPSPCWWVPCPPRSHSWMCASCCVTRACPGGDLFPWQISGNRWRLGLLPHPAHSSFPQALLGLCFKGSDSFCYCRAGELLPRFREAGQGSSSSCSNFHVKGEWWVPSSCGRNWVSWLISIAWGPQSDFHPAFSRFSWG